MAGDAQLPSARADRARPTVDHRYMTLARAGAATRPLQALPVISASRRKKPRLRSEPIVQSTGTL
jgi:hypothetical protein